MDADEAAAGRAAQLHLVSGESTDSLETSSCGDDSLATADSSRDNSSLADDLSDEESICRSPARSPQKAARKAVGPPRIPTEERQELNLPTDADFQFKEPRFRKKKFIFHPFRRAADNTCIPDPTKVPVEVTIPEQLAASYGLYIWPSSPVLAWYLWLNQDKVQGKRVLELGAGTALPGLLAAKIGCKVRLTDDVRLPHCLENCREAIRLNGLQSEVVVEGLSWGLFTQDTLRLKNCLDLLIGSDLFFDPDVFEPLVVTISWLLKHNPGCEFLCTVQERSADWSIEALLLRWGLRASYEYPQDFLRGTGILVSDLTGDHTIFLLRIVLD